MGLMHHPDLFHLLRPLAIFGERFYRQALAAIAWEYERGGLEIGRSESVIHKRMESYEAAKAAAEEKIRRYDHFCYLWAELRKALELFDSAGRIPDGASRQRAGRCWGLGCHRHLLNLNVHVRVPALEDGTQLPVERLHARL